MNYFYFHLSRWASLADIGLILPIAAIQLAWLGIADRRTTMRWALALLAGIAVVGISKLVWALVAWPNPPLGYRVISGHAMLAFAVWPIVLACCTERLLRRFGNWGAAFAYAACGLLSISRLAGAHTLIEVLIGACIGMAIDLRCRPRLMALVPRLRAPLFVIALMIAVTIVQFGSNVWTPRWFNWLARWLDRG